jgi:hypothetical protein
VFDVELLRINGKRLVTAEDKAKKNAKQVRQHSHTRKRHHISHYHHQEHRHAPYVNHR